MSEIEAIEYRIESLQRTLIYVTALVGELFSVVLVLLSTQTNGGMKALMLAGATVMMIVALLMLTIGSARSKDGLWRSMYAKFGKEPDDPPLEDWSESLENRNAFPVDGETND